MSTFDSEDQGMPGYFLPEDSQLRLARLGEYIRFLSRLGQPRTWNEQREWAPAISMEELTICLELLAEQVDLVLAQVSWPAYLEATTAATEPNAEMGSWASDDAGERFAFGVTLDQIDALDRLIQTMSAHGDALAASHTDQLAEHTLPLLGQAIFDGAKTVREILDQVEAQRFGLTHGSRTSVGEERAMYGVGLARLVAEVDIPCVVATRKRRELH